MPTCTIDGREIEVPQGTTVIQAAQQLGIHIPHFCWHPDLAVDGNCRMCMVDIEKAPRLMIACNTQVTDGMVVSTKTERAAEAHRTTLEFLLINHPIDCPVCDQAGECYLQDQYMDHGLHDSRVEIEQKVAKRKVVDLGPIVLDAERCVLCSRCLRFEREVTGTNSFEFVNRGNQTQIATFQNRPIQHGYSGNLADVCPVGALLSHDFRFKMRVWFLEETGSICPGCSTGCNITIDHRDGEPQRFRPRRNPDVNRSWICDEGRALYRTVAVPERLQAPRLLRGSGFERVDWPTALDTVAAKLKDARSAFLATPQASNEDLFAFRLLAEACAGLLDFRVGDPQERLRERLDAVLLRADRNPNTQGGLDLEIGKSGVGAIVEACRGGKIDALVLQGPELLEAVPELEVPFLAVIATHDAPALERAHAVLPAALWAESDGTFTNFQRRVQRFGAAVPPPGEARPRWEIAAGLLGRLGAPLEAASAREVFGLLARQVPAYAGLSHRSLGAAGHALASEAEAALGAPA
jgi:NADH-quinone oxidoreductase subunit G